MSHGKTYVSRRALPSGGALELLQVTLTPAATKSDTVVQVSEPDSTEVQAALERVLASAALVRSDRLQRFLRYIVGHWLAGELGALKESVIGIEVFDRPATYDPKAEPIVRIEARRLRAKLHQYYSFEGDCDDIVIEIPKGGYIPQISRNQHRLTTVPSDDSWATSAQSQSRLKRGVPTAYLLLFVITIALFIATIRMTRTPKTEGGPRVVPMAGFLGNEVTPAISPDGARIAFARDAGTGSYELYVKGFGESPAIRLTSGSSNDLAPSWSPDGTHIAFFRFNPDSTEVMIIRSDGAEPKHISQLRSPSWQWAGNWRQTALLSRLVWTPDEKSLIVSDSLTPQEPRRHLRLLKIDTGRQEPLTDSTSNWDELYPAVSPSGDTLAFVRRRGYEDSLFTLSLSQGFEKRVPFNCNSLRGVTWSANGQSLIASATIKGKSQVWKVPVLQGRPALLYEGRENIAPSSSQDGKRVVVSEVFRNTNIWRVSTEHPNEPPVKLIGSSGRNDSAQYSPDGTTIVFVSNRSGQWNLWKCDSRGENEIQLTRFVDVNVGSPQWSPKGDRIAFDVSQQGHRGIQIFNVTTGSTQALTSQELDAWVPGWSDDGQWLYFVASGSEGNGLWKARVSDGRTIRISHADTFEPYGSSDGKSVYLTRKYGWGILKMSTDGNTTTPIPELAEVRVQRHWAVTRHGIWFIDQPSVWQQEKTSLSLKLFDFRENRTTVMRDVSEFFTTDAPKMAISPDEKWLLYTQEDYRNNDVRMLEYEGSAF